MRINDNEDGEIFVENLRKDPIYKYTDNIDLAPVNYLVANKKYSSEEIAEFISNAENINYNYKKLNAENINGESDSHIFKILGYFSLDSKSSELTYIGKKYNFKIDLLRIKNAQLGEYVLTQNEISDLSNYRL